MKKLIAIAVIILGFGVSVSAQSDSFFTQTYSTYREAETAYIDTPRLPYHALEENQDAPLGAGLLLLTGMGLGYAALRKRD